MRKRTILAAGATLGLATVTAQAQAPAADARAGAEANVESPQLGATDATIASRLGSALEGRDALTNVSTQVRHGVVTLTGTVPSEPVRQEATRLVQRIDGVTSVQNRLAVASRGSTGRAGGGDARSVTAAVASSLEHSDAVDAEPIEVSRISEHAVELSGRVDSDAAKQRASVVAQQTEGVDFVRNELDVESR